MAPTKAEKKPAEKKPVAAEKAPAKAEKKISKEGGSDHVSGDSDCGAFGVAW